MGLAQMAGIQARDFDPLDETPRRLGRGLTSCKMDGITAARYTFEPG
jgi:hypothetical protein